MIKLPDTDGLQDRVRLTEQTGPGPRLRAAREAGCYEIEDIAKQLRLHPQIIRDLEKDKFSDHLALVFVRGYLRAYANLIGLDPEQVVEEFNALGHLEERSLPDLKGKPQAGSRMRSEQEMRNLSFNPRLKWAGITLIVIAMAGVFVAYHYDPKDQLYPVNVPPIEASENTDPTFDPNQGLTEVQPASPETIEPPPAAPQVSAQVPAHLLPSHVLSPPYQHLLLGQQFPLSLSLRPVNQSYRGLAFQMMTKK
jgi:cytoskeleton protein RodZ